VETLAGDAPGWDQILASAEGLTAPPFLKVSRYAEWKDTVATPAFQQYFGDQIPVEGLRQQLIDGWAQVNG
jgi:multiple sugar transport system substrate-binding protein